MCWSLEVSVLTALWSWTVGAYLIKRNTRWDRANAMWTIAVAAVQVADAFLWWDGMSPDTCSITNWRVTFVALPTILKLQCVVRQAELRFHALPRTIAIIAALALLGAVVLPPEQGLVGTLNYGATHGCSATLAHVTGGAVKSGSPVWGGRELPIFNYVIYAYLTGYTMWFSGRMQEFSMALTLLLSVFVLPGAYGSKWCSVAGVFTFYYLFNSGPRVLPIHTKAHYMHGSAAAAGDDQLAAKGTAGMWRSGPLAVVARAMDGYMSWLYGSAHMDGPYTTAAPIFAAAAGSDSDIKVE